MSKPVDIKAYNAEAQSFGQEVTTGDTTYLCCYAASCTAKGVYVITPGVDGNGVGGPVLAGVPNADAQSAMQLAVPLTTLSSAGYVWCAIRGKVTATVTKSSSLDAAGKFLEVIKNTAKFIYEGTSFGVGSAATNLAVHTGSGDGDCLVYLSGKPVTPAAS